MSKEPSVREAFQGQAVPSDRELVWLLIALGIADLILAAYFSIVRVRAGFALFEFGAYLAGALVLVVTVLRLRYSDRYSIAGVFWMLATITTFSIWNGIIALVSVVTRLWAYAQPYAFDFTAVLGLVPVLFTIWKLRAKIGAIRR